MKNCLTIKALTITLYFICSSYATNEYAYNIYTEIDCISKNDISTEEACERWRRNMKTIGKEHVFCKKILMNDGNEARACSPTITVNDDIVTKLSYIWKPSDIKRPITVEIDYTGLSYKQQQFITMLIGTCFVAIIVSFCVNGCPDSSCNDDNFLTGIIVGNMLSNSNNGWGNSNYCDDGYSTATNDY